MTQQGDVTIDELFPDRFGKALDDLQILMHLCGPDLLKEVFAKMRPDMKEAWRHATAELGGDR